MTLTSSFHAREGVGSRSLAAVVVVVGAALVAACQTSTTATDVTAAPDAPKCQVTLGTPGAVAATGGSGKFSVTTQPECSWTASSAVNWISSVSPGSGQGTLDVEFRVAPNEGSSTREGDIVVNESRVRVSQNAPCRYSVSPANQGMSASAGTGSVSVTITSGSDCSWSASSDSGWLTLTGSTSGRSNATVTFSVPSNGNTERTGSIIVAGQRATVTQAAQGSPAPAPGPGPGPGPSPGCTYTIAPTSANAAALGGTGSIAVTTQSGCQWSASSNASWITVTSGGSGTGNGSAGFIVGVNLGAARNGTITIAGQSFTVNQAAALPQSCTYSVSPTNVKMGKGGDSKSVKVTTSSGCAWTASSNTSWISVAPSNGTGTGNVTITASKNNGNKRTGTATVAGQTVTVEQDGA